MLKRNKTWRSDLATFIDEVSRKPFDEWKFNCGFFAADAIKAYSGVDPAAKYRRYKTITRQIAAIRKDGHGDHVGLAASLFEEIHPSQAQVGDILTYEIDDELGSALGICIGERVMVLRPEGLGSMDILQAKRAFRV